MAKSTHGQEVSTGTSDSFTEHELADPNPPVVVQRAMLGGEPKSVGTDSSQSSGDEPQSSNTTNPSPQEPAQTTENPSDQTATVDSDVHSTDGVGQATRQPRSGKRRTTPTAQQKKPHIRSVDDEFD